MVLSWGKLLGEGEHVQIHVNIIMLVLLLRGHLVVYGEVGVLLLLLHGHVTDQDKFFALLHKLYSGWG
jgi:hypothetical protein